MQISSTQLDPLSAKVKAAVDEFIAERLNDPVLLEAKEIVTKAETERKLIVELTEMREGIEAELIVLKEDREVLDKEIVKQQEELQLTLSKKDEALKVVQSHEAQHAALKEQIVGANEEIKELNKKKAELKVQQENQLSNLKVLNDELEKLKNDTELTRAEKDRINSEHQSQVEAIQSKIVEGLAANKEVIDTLNSNRNKLALVLSQNSAAENKAKELQSAIDRVTIELQSLNEIAITKKKELDEKMTKTEAEIAAKIQEAEKDQVYLREATTILESKYKVLEVTKNKVKDVILSLVEKETSNEEKQGLKSALALIDKI